MALGLTILANTRPYEGLLLGLTVGVAMLAWLIGNNRPSTRTLLLRVVAPILVTLIVAGAVTGYYYYRVTGSPFRMTYLVNRDTYAITPYFLFQPPRPEPLYHHAVMRDFYRWELASDYFPGQSFVGLLGKIGDKFVRLWRFYLGPALTLPLFALPLLFRDRKMRWPLLAIVVFLLGLVPITWNLPHYFAPMTALLYLILLQCMRHLRLWIWRGRALGAALVRSIPIICCAMILIRVAAVAVHAEIEPPWPRGNLGRARLVRELNHIPGRHLVIVRYGNNPVVNRALEFVYNAADIDNAKIVWARDMGDQNLELVRYFPDRQVWLGEVGDHSPPRLVPYSPAAPHDRESCWPCASTSQ
jgi:hypothetical protein